MASVENAGGASPLEQEAVVPRASPGVNDMLEEVAGVEPPRHVRRISDSEVLESAAADADAAAATQATDGGAADSDDIRPSGGSPGSGSGDDNNKDDGANRGVEAILKVAASTDDGDDAATRSTAPKNVSPLRPRPHRPTADGGSGGGGANRSKGEKGPPPPQRVPPGMPPPPPGGYPGPAGAYHHPYGPPPYYCKYCNVFTMEL